MSEDSKLCAQKVKVEEHREMFVFSGKNKGWKRSNQVLLACEVADDAVRVSRVLLKKIEDPETDPDLLESLCVSYSDLQRILIEVLRKNFWRRNKMPIRRPRKKKDSMASILK